MTRDEAIRRIQSALRERSGRAWMVTKGRWANSGWICIDTPPLRRPYCRQPGWDDQSAEPGWDDPMYDPNLGELMSPEDGAELGRLLGLGRPVRFRWYSIPPGDDYYREYVDRAEGREPRVHGRPYWD